MSSGFAGECKMFPMKTLTLHRLWLIPNYGRDPVAPTGAWTIVSKFFPNPDCYVPGVFHNEPAGFMRYYQVSFRSSNLLTTPVS